MLVWWRTKSTSNFFPKTINHFDFPKMSQSISTKTLFNSFNAIAKNWPRDPLRPEHQFGPQLQQAAKSVLTNSKGKSKITQLENDEELQKLEFKSFTQEETDYAQKALQSLENLRGNKAAKEVSGKDITNRTEREWGISSLLGSSFSDIRLRFTNSMELFSSGIIQDMPIENT